MSLRALVALAVFASAFAWNRWTWSGPGPGQRASHSLHVYGNKVYLFGGRANDINVPHRPKTYKIVENDGVLSFESYDLQLVKFCSENDTALTCLNIWKGLLFNDLWSYPLSMSLFVGSGFSVSHG
jgi:hypothetical protein